MFLKKISLATAVFSLAVSSLLINQGFGAVAAETIYTYQSAVYSNAWTVTGGQGYNGGGVSTNTSFTPGTEASWTFGTINSAPETYEVFTSWSIDPNRTTSAPYTLYHTNGVFTRQTNQELLANGNPGTAGQWSDWRSLGIFVLNNTSRLVLTAVDNTSGQDFVVADSVRLVPLGGSANNSTSSSSSSISNSSSSSSSIPATGGALSDPLGSNSGSSSKVTNINTTIRTGATE